LARPCGVLPRLPLTDRPAHNLILSNVPGPQTQLYFLGCKIGAMYPLSPLIAGAGLNITVIQRCPRCRHSFVPGSAPRPVGACRPFPRRAQRTVAVHRSDSFRRLRFASVGPFCRFLWGVGPMVEADQSVPGASQVRPRLAPSADHVAGRVRHVAGGHNERKSARFAGGHTEADGRFGRFTCPRRRDAITEDEMWSCQAGSLYATKSEDVDVA
jgi:hypothetical protein